MANLVRNKPAWAIVAMAALGIAAVVFATTWGIGLSPDSVVYISAARNLHEGYGLSVFTNSCARAPLIHFPPLYPLLLTLVAQGGVDVASAARWLSAILFAANILSAGFMISRSSRSPLVGTVVGSFLVLTSVAVIKAHLMAWSEPLFIFCSLWGLYFLARYLDTHRVLLLVLAALMTGLAVLTRYSGLAVIAAGAVSLLCLTAAPFRHRLSTAAVYGAISIGPVLSWSFWQGSGLAATADRVLAWHPIGLMHLKEALYTCSLWFLPAKVPGLIRYPVALIFGAVLIGLALWSVRSRHLSLSRAARLVLDKTPRLLLVLALFVAGYMLFLVVSISLYDYHTPLDERILLPAQVALIVIGCCLLPPLAVVRAPACRVLFIAVLLAFGLSYFLRGTVLVARSHTEGQEYASRTWRTSPTMQYVNGLPATVPIVSNAADAIYAVTGRLAYWVPAKFDPSTLLPNPKYAADVDATRDLLKNAGARLVVFGQQSPQTYWSGLLPRTWRRLCRYASSK